MQTCAYLKSSTPKRVLAVIVIREILPFLSVTLVMASKKLEKFSLTLMVGACALMVPSALTGLLSRLVRNLIWTMSYFLPSFALSFWWLPLVIAWLFWVVLVVYILFLIWNKW